MLKMPENGPVVRVRDLSRSEQCLAYPGFKCNCRLADPEIRRLALREPRQEVGAYSLVNLLDPGVADNYQKGRKGLCEGQPPTRADRFKYALWCTWTRLSWR